MSTGAWLEIDLLRQRRARYGIQRPAKIPVRTLLIKGAAFGSALPLLLLLGCGWLWFSESRLRQKADALQPLADEHDRLEVQIQTEQAVLDAAVKTNQAMARSMADVRSSSALLVELRRLIPQSISLAHARVNSGRLDLNGEALMPNGLWAVNAFMLSLAQSPLFVPDGVALQQARLKQGGGRNAETDNRLSYGLSARFAANAPQAIRPQLASLGAIGLERRLRRIEQEDGLLP